MPENVWKIDELVLDNTKEVDFTKPNSDNWWNAEPLKTLDLSSNVIKVISPNVKYLQHLITLKVSQRQDILHFLSYMLIVTCLIFMQCTNSLAKELYHTIMIVNQW